MQLLTHLPLRTSPHIPIDKTIANPIILRASRHPDIRFFDLPTTLWNSSLQHMTLCLCSTARKMNWIIVNFQIFSNCMYVQKLFLQILQTSLGHAFCSRLHTDHKEVCAYFRTMLESLASRKLTAHTRYSCSAWDKSK